MAINLELAKRVKEISTVRRTREDVIEYYQEKYGGDWRDKFVEAHQGFTTAKNGGLISKKNIERRFQARKGKTWESTKPSKKQQEEYEAHGEYLPPKPPEGIHVEGTVCIRYADQPCEERNLSIDLEGEEMQYFLETFDMQVIINKYMLIDVDTDEPTIAECPCSECGCDFSITPIE